MQPGQVYPREHQVQDEEEGVPVSSQRMENQAELQGELSDSCSLPFFLLSFPDKTHSDFHCCHQQTQWKDAIKTEFPLCVISAFLRDEVFLPLDVGGSHKLEKNLFIRIQPIGNHTHRP